MQGRPSPWTRLRQQDKEEQIGRDCIVHNCRRTALSWIVHGSALNPGQDFRSIASTFEIHNQRCGILETSIPDIPLDSFRICTTASQNTATILQMDFALLFGGHFVTSTPEMTPLAVSTDECGFPHPGV